MRFTGLSSFISFISILNKGGYTPLFDINDIRKIFKNNKIAISKLLCDIVYIDDFININFYNVYGVCVINFSLKRGN